MKVVTKPKIEHRLRCLFGENPAETQEILDLERDIGKFFKKDYEEWFYSQAYRLWQMGWRKNKFYTVRGSGHDN